MRKAISVVVLNENGVLARVSGLFASRGYNIESLTVSSIPNSNFSRLSIVVNGDPKVIDQIVKQLGKLIYTHNVIVDKDIVEKEMILIKIPLDENFGGLDVMLKSYNGTVANANDDFIIVMACDNAHRIDCLIKAIKKYNPIQIVRSGSVIMEM